MNNSLPDRDASGKERSYLFDNIKAILIFAVVIAHYLRMGDGFGTASFGGVVYVTAFSFIMQGFIFISGYFSKNVEKCRQGAFKNFLLPYFLLVPVMFLIRWMIFGHATLNFLYPTFALWFMIVMFVYRFSIKTLSRVPGIIIISSVLMLLSGCLPFLGENLSLGRVFSFLFFFMLGYKCQRRHIEKIRNIKKIYIIGLIALTMGFSVYISLSKIINVEMLQMKEGYEAFDMNDMAGMGARAAIALISIAWIVIFINLIPDRKSCVSMIGQNTMVVYILHIPIRYALKMIGFDVSAGPLYYAVVIMLAVCSVYVFSRPICSEFYKMIIDVLYDKVIMIGLRYIKKYIIRLWDIIEEYYGRYSI